MDEKPKTVTLKPNIGKVLLRNVINILGVVVLIVGIVLLLHFMVGSDIFTFVLGGFGVEIELTTIALYALYTILGIAVLIICTSFFSASAIKYDFLPDKIIVHQNRMLIFISGVEIPYKNITSVSYESKGVVNQLLNTGSIMLDLSGMDRKNVKLEFIDNIEKTTQNIQAMVAKYRAVQQAKFTQDYNVGNMPT